MRYTARVEGIPQWKNALRGVLVSLDRATQRATGDGALLVEREMKLILRLTSHPPGTPTPAPPGTPPSMISGFLARSVETRPARPVGAYHWYAEVGPTAVYARIQELGGYVRRAGLSGVIGPHRASDYIHVPARPYARPVHERSARQIRDNYRRRWAEVLTR